MSMFDDMEFDPDFYLNVESRREEAENMNIKELSYILLAQIYKVDNRFRGMIIDICEKGKSGILSGKQVKALVNAYIHLSEEY